MPRQTDIDTFWDVLERKHGLKPVQGVLPFRAGSPDPGRGAVASRATENPGCAHVVLTSENRPGNTRDSAMRADTESDRNEVGQ